MIKLTKNTKVKNRDSDKENYKITEGQSKFIDNYIVLENAVEAYIRAYPNSNYNSAGVNGHKLLKMDKIQNEIAKRKARLKNSKHIASPEEVLMFLTQTMTSTDEKTSERLRAAELIGKTTGMWVDRVETTNQTEFVIELGDSSKNQLDVIDMPVDQIEHDE